MVTQSHLIFKRRFVIIPQLHYGQSCCIWWCSKISLMLPIRHLSTSYFLSLIFGPCLIRWKQYRCRVDAASLFSCAGQLSVTPEYNLKNATIFSNAPYVHLESEGEGKKGIWLHPISIPLGPRVRERKYNIVVEEARIHLWTGVCT